MDGWTARLDYGGVVSRHTAPEPKKYSPHHMGSFPPGIMYPVPRTFYLTTRPLGFSSSHREANNLHARIVLCSQIGEVMETLYRRKGAARRRRGGSRNILRYILMLSSILMVHHLSVSRV